MSSSAIRVDGLGKRYLIGRKKEKYYTFREAVTESFVAPVRRAKRLLSGQATGAADLDREFWALKDITFEVKQGEVVGIIGGNGAGKSTLLKILTRITEPTTGLAELSGQVGSLLEVGSGFHPELTGRENIYLNGAILGMRKRQIDGLFDEIIAFAEIERFIDTPVKHYSSGMYVRLAFAVAAHLEPEILLVDEVLAVGDARFQKKCMTKLQDVGNCGRTVLFVSHNMTAINTMCRRVMLLEEGSIVFDGPTQEALRLYLDGGKGIPAIREWTDSSTSPGNDIARLRTVRVRLDDGRCASCVDIREAVNIEAEYEVMTQGQVLMAALGFWNQQGTCAFVTMDMDPKWRGVRRPEGRYVSTVRIPGNFLAEGSMTVNVALCTLEPFDHICHETAVVGFQVIDSLDGDTARGDYRGLMRGVVRPVLQWTTELRKSCAVTSP